MTERQGQTQTILDRLQALAPGEDIIFAAIEQLREPDEIRQFRSEYEKSMCAHAQNGETRQQIADITNKDIGFVLGFYADQREIVSRWLRTLEEISHPEFGRSLSEDLWKSYVSF